MSQKERRRLAVMSQVQQRKLTLRKASELLSVSYRQAKRVWSRYEAEGDGALVHRLRGRSSNHRGGAELRERVLARCEEEYGDYGPTLAAECLAEEGLVLPGETLRQWLKAAGLWSGQRRLRAHRHRRTRKEQWGELLQMDGSHHDWFEGRSGPNPPPGPVSSELNPWDISNGEKPGTFLSVNDIAKRAPR